MKKKNDFLGTFILLFFLFLAIEAVLDVVLLPADEVLIPGEIIMDAAALALVAGTKLVSR